MSYSFEVTNSGYVPLYGPVTVSDDKTTVTCPAVTSVGDGDNYLDPADYPTGSGSLAEKPDLYGNIHRRYGCRCDCWFGDQHRLSNGGRCHIVNGFRYGFTGSQLPLIRIRPLLQ